MDAPARGPSGAERLREGCAVRARCGRRARHPRSAQQRGLRGRHGQLDVRCPPGQHRGAGAHRRDRVDEAPDAAPACPLGPRPRAARPHRDRAGEPVAEPLCRVPRDDRRAGPRGVLLLPADRRRPVDRARSRAADPGSGRRPRRCPRRAPCGDPRQRGRQCRRLATRARPGRSCRDVPATYLVMSRTGYSRSPRTRRARSSSPEPQWCCGSSRCRSTAGSLV